MRTVPTRQRWLLPVLGLVVALTAGGGLLTQELYSTDSSARPDSDTGTSPGAISTPSSVPPRRQPGSPEVKLTPGAAAHPHGDEIRALLQAYFDAINRRDYRLWTTTVTAQWVHMKPEPGWREGYRSTHDGNILVYRIDALGGGTQRVLFAFTSTQDEDDAPRALPLRCIRWHVALPVVNINGGWKLDEAPARTAPEGSRCTA